MTFFWCKFGFEKCFGASSQSSHWAGFCWLSYKICFSLHITNWLKNGSLLLLRIEKAILQQFFDLMSAHEAPPLIEVFNFPICFKCQMTVEWSMLVNFSYSYKRIGFNDPLSLSLWTSDDWPLWSSSLRLSPLQNFLNLHSFVHLLAVAVSCVHCFTTPFELEWENHLNLLFV